MPVGTPHQLTSQQHIRKATIVAQQLLVRYVDDIDGTAADSVETVQFAVDGVSYEIDLNETNSAKLRNALATYISNARRTGGRARRGQQGSTGTRSKADTEAIREWARANGHQISDRGRIPSRVIEAYAAAN
jgi:hypothetical protein